jgi:hypothetical protein
MYCRWVFIKIDQIEHLYVPYVPDQTPSKPGLSLDSWVLTGLRRIDLLCKLVAPLFVSLLTSVASYPFTVAFLGFFGLGTMMFEFICECCRVRFDWLPRDRCCLSKTPSSGKSPGGQRPVEAAGQRRSPPTLRGRECRLVDLENPHPSHVAATICPRAQDVIS